jgi:hypothetical protein
VTGSHSGLDTDLRTYLYLYLCSCQDIFETSNLGDDGFLLWELLTYTCGSGREGSSTVHNDVWDIHISDDYPDTGKAWLATDGGIFRRPDGSSAWATNNSGLHTHHIHKLTVLPTSSGGSSRLAYSKLSTDGCFRGPVEGQPIQFAAKSFGLDAPISFEWTVTGTSIMGTTNGPRVHVIGPPYGVTAWVKVVATDNYRRQVSASVPLTSYTAFERAIQ